MSREAFDVEAALEKCHKGTAWQRDLIRAQLIDARAAALEEAAKACESEAENWRGEQSVIDFRLCAARIRALKEKE